MSQARTSQPRTFRYAKYLRKSTEEDLSRSIVNQESVLTGLLQSIVAADSVNCYEDAGVYCDEDYTGTDSDRPAFKRLLKDLASGAVNMLLVTDLSRLSRNISESVQYVQSLFVALDIRFVSLQLPALDSFLEPERIYSMEIPIQSMMNENHCAETSFKVRRTFQRLRQQGVFFGAFAPYGYQKDGLERHQLTVDEPAARIVRSIFSWFVLDGMSKRAISMRLNTLGVPSPATYKKQLGSAYYNPNVQDGTSLWTPKTVADILKNPVYTGAVCQGKQQVKSYKLHTRQTLPRDQWIVVKHMHPAIISQAQFDQAQALCARPSHTAPGAQTHHLFSGLIRCASCHKAMTRRVSRGRAYYACRTHVEQSATACSRHSIREDRLHDALSAVLQLQIDLMPNKAAALQDLQNLAETLGSAAPLESLLQAHEAECQSLVGLQDELYLDYKKGTITPQQYERLSNRLAGQLERARQHTETLRSELSQRSHAPAPQQAAFESLLKTGQLTLQRGLLTALVACVQVHQGGALSIHLQFRDELLSSVDVSTNLQPPAQ